MKQVVFPAGFVVTVIALWEGAIRFFHIEKWLLPAPSNIALALWDVRGLLAEPRCKNITRPRDFEGKKYGGEGLPMERAILGGLMRADGGDVSRVNFVSVGVSDLLTLLQRDIDSRSRRSTPGWHAKGTDAARGDTDVVRQGSDAAG